MNLDQKQFLVPLLLKKWSGILTSFFQQMLNQMISSIYIFSLKLCLKNDRQIFKCLKTMLKNVWFWSNQFQMDTCHTLNNCKYTAIIRINSTFACLWSKTAILTEVWCNINMQPRPWASQALLPHSWAFQKGI